MHDWWTIRTALTAFKGNFYQKHICSRIVQPRYQKIYINLKGLPNKKNDFCVRKSIISRQIRSRIIKGFSPWVRGPGGIVWWKKPGFENLVTLSL
jgi:hypothetical protein